MARKRRRGPTTEERNALLLALRRYKREFAPSELPGGLEETKDLSSAIRKLAKGKLGSSPDLNEDEYAALINALEYSAGDEGYSAEYPTIPTSAEKRHLRGLGQMPAEGFWEELECSVDQHRRHGFPRERINPVDRRKLLESRKRLDKYDG